MRILYLCHYYPPEANAPANRVSELAREWVASGDRVTVVTCAPSHPRGVVYPGYRNRLFQREMADGVEVIRLWSYLAANEGVARRTLSYLSYAFSVLFSLWRLPAADVVISTSPQFFCGLIGSVVAWAKRAPWVLEIRDLWPESIVEVGAVRKGLAIRMLEWLEAWGYRHARQIISVSPAFGPHMIARGADPEHIAVVENGVDLTLFAVPPDATAFRAAYGLTGRFVAAYVGTHGMAHHLETILEAAALTRHHPTITWLLVGDGAERSRLEAQKAAMDLDNVVMLGPQPRQAMPLVWGATDVSLVLLRKSPLFLSVIPSKMFEAMAMGRPIVMGVEGQAKQILEAGRCGVAVEPENAQALADVVLTLAADQALRDQLGGAGTTFVREHYDRKVLAARFRATVEALVGAPARVRSEKAIAG